MTMAERTLVEVELEKAELDALLASKMFQRAPGLAKMLSYLCRKYFAGQEDQIKEYTIAVELFGRTPEFQSKEDPIVRVEATRLRTRLKEYYQSEGKTHALQVFIPLGQYAPVFRRITARRTCAAGNGGLPAKSPAGLYEMEVGAGMAQTGPVSEGEAGVPTSRIGRYSSALLVLGVGLILVFIAWWTRGNYREPPVSPLTQRTTPEIAATAQPPFRGSELFIMAGSTVEKYVDQVGKVWESDRYYSGGTLIAATPAALQRADLSPLVKFARAGDFEYAIPLKPGIYELHLFFAEMQFGVEPEEGGETSRLFSVFANDRPILDAFDVFSDAGGGGKVDEKVFTDISPSQDGKLHLSFRSALSKAILSGLAIFPGERGRMLPIRITTRKSPYLSRDQQLWEPDRYFRGGRSVMRLNPVEGSSDPELYQSERYGNFAYVIPVAPGSYTLTLKFAETYFGPAHSQHIGPEKRLFDVWCNGQTLLKDFNIARESGGLRRTVDKVFHKVRPNAQGKLVLSFVPVMNYACVNAIEVKPD